MSEKKLTGTVVCIKCRFYQVTWEPRQPYGCLAHGFKSPKNPALVVFESSGIECQLFEPKPNHKDTKTQRRENTV
jgi:hypothetical protein